jgi:O-acetyl-ADP-ribose deacetylase (regulator of RNase III)
MAAIEVVRGDITAQHVDAIVNAANSHLVHGGGVAAAIAAAGGPELVEASRKHDTVPVGDSGWTPAGDLSARWVVHAVGPIWSGGEDGEPELLAGAYRSALHLADELGAQSVAFPSISTGIYGYPLEAAAAVAVAALTDELDHAASVKLVRICLFSQTDLAAYERALREVRDRRSADAVSPPRSPRSGPPRSP